MGGGCRNARDAEKRERESEREREKERTWKDFHEYSLGYINALYKYVLNPRILLSPTN